MKIKENEGITLISLVITIIVLLILAGVTINMVLGDNGIIGQAQGAKTAQTKAEEEQTIKIATGEAAIASYGTQIPKTLSELTSIFTTLTEETYKNNVAKVEDGVPIPIGFTYVEGTKKNDGLIIVDGSENEFVWVPVDGTLPMFKYSSATGNYTGKSYNWKDWTGEGNPKDLGVGYKEPEVLPNNGTSTNSIQDEYNKMAKSVEIYGGFYVGRYETGGFNSTKVVSKAGENKESCTNVDWYTMYSKQKALYSNANDSVTSGMIYGSQWDAIMDWMKDIDNPNVIGKKYIIDSTGMGHYCYDKNTNQTLDNAKPIATGSNNEYKVKNIYDLAGNYLEWTQETFSFSTRVDRGGDYAYHGSISPVSHRNTNYPTSADGLISSRLQFYIK